MRTVSVEQQLLYVLLRNGSAISQCDLSPQDFTNQTDQMIYEAILSVASESKPIDMITVAEHLENKYRTVDMAYLGQLFENGVGLLKHVDSYLDIIRKGARNRRARDVALTLQADIESNSDGDHIANAISQLMTIDATRKNHNHRLKDCLHSGLESVQQAMDKGGMIGIETGLKELDAATGGYHNTDLTVIGARPAMGKSQPLTSSVLMSNGEWKKMGDVQVGDNLASVDGDLSQITDIFPQGERDIYKLTLSDGREVECDLEHLWSIESSKFKGVKTCTTSELILMLKSERFQNRVGS